MIQEQKPDKRFKVTILVDEETLRDAADAEDDESTTAVLDREFGWMNSSGVVIEKIEEVPNAEIQDKSDS